LCKKDEYICNVFFYVVDDITPKNINFGITADYKF